MLGEHKTALDVRNSFLEEVVSQDLMFELKAEV